MRLDGPPGTTLDLPPLERTYLATPSVVGLARRDAERQTVKWGVPELNVYDITTVVSEYVTNVVQNCPNTEFAMRIAWAEDGVLIEVWDKSPDVPKARDVADETGGWGLHVVADLAQGRCGYRLVNGGKTVFALVPAH